MSWHSKAALGIAVLALTGCGPEKPASAASSEVSATTPPATPASFSASGGYRRQIDLSWFPVTGADSYTIYWNTTGTVTTGDTPITGITDTSYVHGGLINTTTYFYIVVAVNVG